MPVCSHCGGNVSPYDRFCSYCGTENPAYRPPEAALSALLEEGLQAFRAEQFSRAIECYEQVIALDADIFDAYFYLAACYEGLHWHEKAIAAMERAREIRPGNAPIYYNLAMLYQETGHDTAKVRAMLEEALKRADGMSPDFRKRVEKELRKYKKKWFWQR